MLTPDVTAPTLVQGAVSYQSASTAREEASLGVSISKVQILQVSGGLLGPNSATVYPIVLTTCASQDPDQAVRLTTFAAFNHVHDGDLLPLADGAPWFVFAGEIPKRLDVHILLMRSRQPARETAQLVARALQTSEAKAVTAAISAAMAGPLGAATVHLGAALLEIVALQIADSKDEQLFYAVGTIIPYVKHLERKLTFTNGRTAWIEVLVSKVEQAV